MVAMAGNDDATMAQRMMRAKNLLMVKMFAVVAEVTSVETAASKV